MKTNIVPKLICPSCRRPALEILKIINKDKVEIRQGILKCAYCDSEFRINDGILDFLIDPEEEILNEQKGWAILKNAINNSDELMLSLPDGIEEYKDTWKGQANNFYHMVSSLNLKGNENILDIGAGRCWASRYFAKYGCDVIAIDILLTKYVGLLTSDLYIKNDNIYFERILSDMTGLPFKDNTFEYVFVSASLHHSLDLLKSLKEVKRVLKPKGRFIITNEPVRGIIKNNRKDNEEIKVGINEKDYRLREYLDLLERAGFNYELEFWLGGNPMCQHRCRL